MNTATIDLTKLNLALQFAQELLRPVCAQNLVRMVQESIIPTAPPKGAPVAEKAVEGSAEGEEGVTNG